AFDVDDGRAQRPSPEMPAVRRSRAAPGPPGQDRREGRDRLRGVVRCSKCDAISNVVTREPKPISVPLVVSWLDRSEKTSLEFSPDEDVSVGEELDLGDTRISVTAIESKGRRV